MKIIMEAFNEERIAHPRQAHIFAVPRLIAHFWRKHMGKVADVVMTITTGNHFWEKIST